jgi:hypothetical protein
MAFIPPLRLIQTKCRLDFNFFRTSLGFSFSGIGVNRFDPDVGGQLIPVAIINIAPAGSDFHSSQILPIRLGREAIVLDDLELNQTPHQHQT